MKYGYNQEFFIEGGRSRTGKLRYPKYGLLNYYVGAVSKGIVEDLYFVPISISYDTVAETSSYTSEQKGVTKKKESIGLLFKIKKALKKNYGKVYMRFGTPISLQEYMKNDQSDYKSASEEGQKLFIKKLAFTIMRGIDKVTMITPVTLTSMVLLSSKSAGLYIQELKSRVYDILKLIKQKNLPYSQQLDSNFDLAIKYSLERLMKEKEISVNFIEGMDSLDERVYYVNSNKRLNVNYYKNSIISFFVVRSIVLLSIKVCINDNMINIQYFWDNVKFLRNLLKFEFFFSDSVSFKQEVMENLYSFINEHKSMEDISSFENITFNEKLLSKGSRYLLPFFESYYTVAKVLEKMGEKPFNKKDLMIKIKLMYEKLLWTGEVNLIESHSEVTYTSALTLFESMSVLESKQTDFQVNPDKTSKETLLFMMGNIHKFIKLS